MPQRRYIRRRSRRMLSYTLVFGVGFLLTAFQTSRDTIWLPLVWGFRDVMKAQGFSETIAALQLFLMLDLPPFAFTLMAFALVAFTIAFVATLIAITIVPFRYQSYLDGMVGIAAIIVLFEGLGLGAIVRAAFGNVGSMLFYWAAFMATSSIVWKYLPFGFSYKGHATRSLSLPIEEIADRLIPGRAPDVDLADIDLVNRPPQDGEHQVFVEAPNVTDDGTLSFTIHHEGQNGFVRGQTMSYTLTPQSDASTELAIRTTLTGIAPMSLWDFWSRNFAEDYADHLDARLRGDKDGSVYGNLQKAAWRRLEKRRLRTASP